MATVTVAFTALPAHVRTARFISASVARRAGVDEHLLDEIRLAVSEACSLAVRLHLAHAPAEPVQLRLTEDAGEFRIEVADAVARNHGAVGAAASNVPAADDLQATIDDSGELVDLRARERIGLAVIAGLVDDFTVDYGQTGSVVTMSWPIATDAAVQAFGGVSPMT